MTVFENLEDLEQIKEHAVVLDGNRRLSHGDVRF